MNGFCEKKFRSMLISGTFTKQFCSLFGLKDMTALSSAIPALRIVSLGFVLSGLMEAHDEKAYLVTTGYNRNMIRFSRS